ncbi:hypothetical protein ACOSQ2_002976 [Xanthoceras sorbifolium]
MLKKQKQTNSVSNCSTINLRSRGLTIHYHKGWIVTTSGQIGLNYRLWSPTISKDWGCCHGMTGRQAQSRQVSAEKVCQL